MNTIVFIQFKADQEYIAQTLCMNRDNPANTCCGKCYLKTTFKKSESKSKQFQSYCKEKIVLFLLELKEIVFADKHMCTMYFSIYCKQQLPSIAIDIFHPPS